MAIRRFAIATMTIMSLLLSAGTVAAADGGATVEIKSASFALLSSLTCSNLPEGTSITWTGTEKSITRTRTDSNGVMTIGNTTHAAGVATDQNGNAYAFNYSNEFRISNTVANPGVFSGLMTDSFSLAGQGPARLHNGFIAVFTTDFASFSFEPLNSRGDPIDFATGAAHCDPL
jgi:hypothetical protein